MSLELRSIPTSLPPTRKLFHKDNYALTAEGTVLYSEEEFLILDRSIFYAESGGQEADQGFIDGIRVLDAQHQGGVSILPGQTRVPVSDIKIDTKIALRLSLPSPFRPGDIVRQTIDWDRRYQLMRQHSACHFMFFAIQHIYALQTSPIPIRGCHTNPTSTRLDFLADLSSDLVGAAEEYANTLIARCLPIEMVQDSIVPDVYYWFYSNLPPMPCGGTHVRSASELGPIRLRREKKGRGLTRISAMF